MADKLHPSHVLAFPFPAEGHINPMLNFSKRLASKGLKVTLIIPCSTKRSANQQDSADHLFNIEYISDGTDEGEEPDTIVAYFKRVYEAMSKDLVKLVDKLKESDDPAKVLVYDSTMTWALDLAQQLGLLGASFFTESCAASTIYYHMHQGRVKIPPPEGEKSSVSIALLPLLEMDDLPFFPTAMDPELTIPKFFADQFSNVEKANWILFNTFDKLESEVCCKFNFESVLQPEVLD